MGEINIKKAHKGFQEKFVRSNVDVCFGGGGVALGKSYAAVLSVAEYLSVPEFRGVFIRKNLSEVKIAGGLYDIARSIYGDFADAVGTDSPRMRFESGAELHFTHAADERPKQFLERIKGWQYDWIYLDELTSYRYNTFQKLLTRNRGGAGIGFKIRGTTNPHNKHWIRRWVDWYIGPDGFIRKDRDGVVRYFFVTGETVDDVVWGNSKEEVYRLCKEDIDRKLKLVNGGEIKFTYENYIKSFVFYAGSIAENITLMGNNKDYVGSIAASGGKSGQQLLEGNWNVDPNEAENKPITSFAANEVFQNEPQINNDKWITVDLADHGTDNYVALVWDGFEVIDYSIMTTSTPRTNAARIKQLMEKFDVGGSHVIYDATGNGRYINDVVDEAIPIISSRRPIGLEALGYVKLKDALYGRLIWMINNNGISFKKGLPEKIYQHQNLAQNLTIRKEFCEECAVVQWTDQTSGKKRLANKKEMNALLGHHRSMDLLDPMAFRMYPILSCEKGEELGYGVADEEYDAYLNEYNGRFKNKGFNVFNDNNWA